MRWFILYKNRVEYFHIVSILLVHINNLKQKKPMNEKHIIKIAEELNLKVKQVEATAVLLKDDATVP